MLVKQITQCVCLSHSSMTNVKQIKTVSQMTHSVCFSHCSNHETTKINLSKIDGTVCQIKSIFNDQEKIDLI